ncbi:MAG: metallophosphoesterase, partial [Planctomycetota bacterium]|nr:metallophosphoesterase [Planctomycetota bacterium]
FDYAGSHFVIVDTNFPFSPGSAQYRWLDADLVSEAARTADWLLTFHHHPPYSEIYEEEVYARVRNHLVPLYEIAGVDVNFTGHIHDYERGVYVPPDTKRRIAYIQTSGGGGRLWDDEFGGEWEQIDRVIQYVHHVCVVDVTAGTLRIRAIALDGSVIDEVTLEHMTRGACDGCKSSPSFVRGDTNADGAADLSDAVALLVHLFVDARRVPACLKSADHDDSGGLGLTDAVYLLNHLFLNGPALPAPSMGCGNDPTADGLTCESYPPCG